MKSIQINASVSATTLKTSINTTKVCIAATCKQEFVFFFTNTAQMFEAVWHMSTTHKTRTHSDETLKCHNKIWRFSFNGMFAVAFREHYGHIKRFTLFHRACALVSPMPRSWEVINTAKMVVITPAKCFSITKTPKIKKYKNWRCIYY